jgi:hypothetical protein
VHFQYEKWALTLAKSRTKHCWEYDFLASNETKPPLERGCKNDQKVENDSMIGK